MMVAWKCSFLFKYIQISSPLILFSFFLFFPPMPIAKKMTLPSGKKICVTESTHHQYFRVYRICFKSTQGSKTDFLSHFLFPIRLPQTYKLSSRKTYLISAQSFCLYSGNINSFSIISCSSSQCTKSMGAPMQILPVLARAGAVLKVYLVLLQTIRLTQG